MAIFLGNARTCSAVGGHHSNTLEFKIQLNCYFTADNSLQLQNVDKKSRHISTISVPIGHTVSFFPKFDSDFSWQMCLARKRYSGVRMPEKCWWKVLYRTVVSWSSFTIRREEQLMDLSTRSIFYAIDFSHRLFLTRECCCFFRRALRKRWFACCVKYIYIP